jgi:VWFA-related protein
MNGFRHTITWSRVSVMRTILAIFAICTLLGSKALPQQAPIIRTTTRLVQFTVIVQDKSGAPVLGLNKNAFTLLDGGRPQHIAFFTATSPAHDSPHPLPTDVFTNRADLEGEDPAATVIILFDALNTAFEDQVQAREQILRFLKTVKPQDHVAILALANSLILVHDFTEDSAALGASINRFSPHLMAAFDASHPDSFSVPALAGDPFWKAFADRVNNANGEVADSRTVDRYRSTYNAIVAIADYVTNIPGRKSLVWISGGIPIQLNTENIGTPDRDHVSFDNPTIAGKEGESNLSGLARVLNRADMAIYPIDAHGVDLDSTSGSFFLRQNQRDTFRMLAEKTGGKAFFGSNDLAASINSAFNDDRCTYTLGFYPNHGTWDGRFREVKITLPVDGARLRYRHGYFAVPERVVTDETMKADLQEAARSPIDATSLGVIVKTKPLRGASAATLEIQVTLDPKQFLLRDEGSRKRGGLDLLFLQKDSSGNFLAAEKQHFDVNFKPREYESLAKSGLILQRPLVINAASTQIRTVVRDAGSGALGSVTIPLKNMF